MNRKVFFAFILLLCSANYGAFAQVCLPSVIGNNMVLQQKSEVPLWGWDAPGAKIEVTQSWDTTIVKTICDNSARWKVALKTPGAGGPYTVTIKGSSTITLKNVMTGEVWLCSGQSNMEMNADWGIKNGTEEIKNADFPNIRFFQVKKVGSETPQNNCFASWNACSPETMRSFSAAAYFFGRELQQKLNVPIGLINASWGGTPAEVWTPAKIVEEDSLLSRFAKKLIPYIWRPVGPGVLYNAMIAPLIPFRIAGTIWYQGESNASFPQSYYSLFSTLIRSWRNDFGYEFPFYFVQIAPFTYDKGDRADLIREAQMKTLSVSRTGMVVTTDLVDDIKNIHPKDKQTVGKRLANLALEKQYAVPGIIGQSPVYRSMKVEKNKIRVFFDYLPTKLVCKGVSPSCLEIAGEDLHFVQAEGKIEKNRLIVYSKSIKHPVAVRFAFKNDAVGNLFSQEGLPVSPFRTDNCE